MDYINMPPEELERLERETYNSGDTDRAALLAAVLELQEAFDKVEELESELETIKRETEDHEAYKSFFEDCFNRLGEHYPCAEVTSNYDRSVIFDAIERGEELRSMREGEE